MATNRILKSSGLRTTLNSVLKPAPAAPAPVISSVSTPSSSLTKSQKTIFPATSFGLRDWCRPCRMVHRIIDEIAEEYAGKIRCFLLNTDNDLDIAEDYDIKAVPVVFLLFNNGQRRESVVGTMPKDFFVAAIQREIDF
ncbi:hypothetical protein ACJRO7_027518 [Eucalyptus globulus]|uniref:Thioredoxin domain-containing protein n=1 Tax=Eucalyptus globulus TaxID=34317 RepID=A0ABD3JRH4_EUCGL